MTERYPPSASKIKTLRKKGVFVFSRRVLCFAQFLSLFLLLELNTFSGVVEKLSNLGWKIFPLEDANREVIFSLAFEVLILIPVVFVFSVLLIGLIHTTFYLNFSELNPPHAKKSTSSGELFATLASLLGLMAIFWVFWWPPTLQGTMEYRISADQSPEKLIGDLLFELKFLVRVILGAVFIYATLSWFLQYFRFRDQHAMSREEYERELREEEALPEMREALEERRYQ